MKHKNNSTYQAPLVILVRPQLAQNMGMVARSMMNCGLSQLRMVVPRENHLSAEALSASSGAQVILEQAEVFGSLEEAISDISYLIATTARVRGMNKPFYAPEKAVQTINHCLNKNQKVGLLFGPERTGLENSDIIMANALLTIPLNPIHPSLNLAQAVLLVGWSWWQSTLTEEKKNSDSARLAPKKELNLFLNFLLKHLENKNYFKIKNKKEKMEQNLKNIFTKSLLTSSEIKTLYRVIKRLLGTSQK